MNHTSKRYLQAVLALGLAAGAANAAQLRGTVSTAEPAYDLTTLGTVDWAHWGIGGAYGTFDHKSTGGGQISDVTPIGEGQQAFANIDANPRAATWTDGTPTPSASGEPGYYYTEGNDSGWSFTVPADTTIRTLYIYLGGWGTTGTLTANLSDGSAPDYVQTVSGPANYQNVVAVTFQAGSAGQTLTISFVRMAGDGGSLDLKAAWLTLDDPPAGPTVAITEPLDGANQTAPGSFTISAQASDPDGGTVTQVEFLAGANSIGIVTKPPYTVTWNAVPLGNYLLTAKATDNSGLVTTSTPVRVGVYSTGGSLQGMADTADNAGYDLTALGTADWAHWGRVGGLNFDHKLNGKNQISDVTPVGTGQKSFNNLGANPRAATWTDGTPTESIYDEPGYYYTEALDSGWSFTVSASKTPATLYVYCGGWGVFHTLTAHLSDWSSPDFVNIFQQNGNYQNVYAIDFSAASDNQSLTVTLLKTGNEPGGNGSVDLKAAWLVGGSGAVLPTVKLIEPSTNATFVAPAKIKFTAEATANAGSITKVEFFAGTNLVGTASASPYTYTWDNVPVGHYTFTAKATDSSGRSTVTDPIALFVAGASGGSLQGSYVTAEPAYDLTALGTADWAHWGREGGPNFDHKNTAWRQISDVTLIGTGHNSFNNIGANPRAATWTDGTPTESISDEPGYYYTEAMQSGWSFTVPADTTPRKLFVYCGGWGVFQTLTASLSDHSAQDYVETYQHGGNYQNVYEIDYKAGSAGQKLTVTLVKTGHEPPAGNGSVDLKAAWLVGGGAFVTIDGIKAVGTKLNLSIVRSDPAATLVIRETDNLKTPQWNQVQGVVFTTEADGKVTAAFDKPAGATRFYRVQMQ